MKNYQRMLWGVIRLVLEKHRSGFLTEEGIQVETGGQDGGRGDIGYKHCHLTRRR